MIKIISLVLSFIGLFTMVFLINFPQPKEIYHPSSIKALNQNQIVYSYGEIKTIYKQKENTKIILDNEISFTFSEDIPEKYLNSFVKIQGKVKKFGKEKYLIALEITPQ